MAEALCVLGEVSGMPPPGLQLLKDELTRRKGEVELVGKTLVSILIVLTLAGRLENRVTNRLRKKLSVSVLRWTLTVWSTRGYRCLLTELKGLSHHCRTIALNSIRHPRRNHYLAKAWFGLKPYYRNEQERFVCAQVARLARSLPVCPASWLPAVKKEYLDTVCPPEEKVTDPDILRQFKLLATAWAKKNFATAPRPCGKTSTKACFSHNTQSGGSNFAYAELPTPEVQIPDDVGDRLLDQLCGYPTQETGGAMVSRRGFPVLQGLVQDAAKLSAAFSRLSVRETLCQTRVSVLRERGGKTRTVTCHEIDELVAAHFLRDIFWGALTQWPPTRDAVAGDADSAIRRVVRGCRKGRRVYSSDLSSATDLLHQDVAKCVVSAALWEWGFSHELCAVAEKLLGHHSMDSRVQRRGILMGSPLSWTVLNLTNFFCYCLSLGSAPRDVGAALKLIEEAEQEVSLCGDDLIGFSKLETIAEYERIAPLIGYAVNKEKSFVSSHAGIFTEVSFAVNGVKKYVPELYPSLGRKQKDLEVRFVESIRRFGDIPARLFTPAVVKPGQVPDMGPELAEALKRVPKHLKQVMVKRMRRCAGIVSPGLTMRLLSVGIDPGAPRGLGGAELPWCRSRLKVTSLLASVLASGNVLRRCAASGDTSGLLDANLASGWSPMPYIEGADLAMSLAQADFPSSTLGLSEPLDGYDNVPVHCVHAGNFESALRSSAAAHLQNLRSFGVVPKVGPRSIEAVGLFKLSRRLRAARGRLLSLYPNAPPSSNLSRSLDRWKSIADRISTGPFHPSQTVLKARGSRHRHRYDVIVAHPDTNKNIHNLWTVCSRSIPDISILIPTPSE